MAEKRRGPGVADAQVMTALVTPLTHEREVDVAGVAGLVRRALADGATGVLVAGSTGEGALLEPAQRVLLARCAREAVDAATAPATVVAGATGPTLETLVADVTALADAGADLVLVLAPHTYPLHPEELVDLHTDVADRVAVPTLVYHIPQLTGSALNADAVLELAAHPRIVGMKDSSPDADRRARFVEVTRHVEDFAVLTGHAPSLAAALRAGAAGSITAIANVRQREVVALHRAVVAGDAATVDRLQEGLARLTDAVAAVPASTPAVLKAMLQLDGVIEERWCRRPLRSVPPGRLDQVRTAGMV